MADFSEYTGPSADWVALAPTLPKVPDLPLDQLLQALNKDREDRAAEIMAEEGSWMYLRVRIGYIGTSL